MELLTDKIESPIGEVLLAAADGKLIALEFAQVHERFDADLKSRFGDCTLKPARNPFGFSDRVRAYFRGELTALDDIPVDGGGTAFQRKVWAALREIPAGATKSYSDLAAAVGRGALPSRDRQGRLAHRLWRRPRPQALASAA
jgi:methylated-DNA-[protein]-cysteine S-methyltransferase